MAKRRSTTHYINNDDFLKSMLEWKKQVREAEKSDEPQPPVTPYIAQCFLEIANNLAKKPNFVNYPFKDDMIGDAVENCLMYCGNFNPRKSKNPFSYFTQITYFAFLRRIQREKKQNYIKYKYLQEVDPNSDFITVLQHMGISEDEVESLKKMDPANKPKKRKRKTTKKKNTLG